MKKELVSSRWIDCIYLFFVGSIIGWGYEVILHLIQNGVFVNRGILYGPWLPIYGTGCVLMVFLKRWVGDKPVQYFLSCVAASAVLEYTTSWAMEKIYHTRWWDYSSYFLNLNGRVFLFGLLGFGAAGCFFVYILLPRLEVIYRRYSSQALKFFVLFIGILFLLDVGVSLFSPNMGIGVTGAGMVS